MGATFSDRLSQLGYVKARRLLVLAGVLVLGVVALTMYARSVDTVEVVATLLFLPIFLAFVYRGVVGGVIAARGRARASTSRSGTPAIDAIGADEFTGLIVSRAAAYLIFGAVGGWAMQVLEGSLEKLELYDEIDDETGLYNARHLLQQTDLETARARRYQTLFSAVELDFPAAPLNALKAAPAPHGAPRPRPAARARAPATSTTSSTPTTAPPTASSRSSRRRRARAPRCSAAASRSGSAGSSPIGAPRSTRRTVHEPRGHLPR